MFLETWLKYAPFAALPVPTFASFLKEVDSPYEVHDYVRAYLGDTPEAKDFAKQFIERRAKQNTNQHKQAPPNQQQLLKQQQVSRCKRKLLRIRRKLQTRKRRLLLGSKREMQPLRNAQTVPNFACRLRATCLTYPLLARCVLLSLTLLLGTSCVTSLDQPLNVSLEAKSVDAHQGCSSYVSDPIKCRCDCSGFIF